MSKESQKNNLVKVKEALADKYMRQAKVCKSKPGRQRFLHYVEKYRRQAEDAARQ